MYKGTNKKLKNLVLPSSQEAIDKGMKVIRYYDELKNENKIVKKVDTSTDNYSADDYKLRKQLGF